MPADFCNLSERDMPPSGDMLLGGGRFRQVFHEILRMRRQRCELPNAQGEVTESPDFVQRNDAQLAGPTPGYRFGNDGEPDPVFNHAANCIEAVQPHTQFQPLAGSRCLFIQKVLPGSISAKTHQIVIKHFLERYFSVSR
jgi:hypothetical protein